MKFIYILTWVLFVGIAPFAHAQDYASAKSSEDTSAVVLEAETGEVNALFNTPATKARSKGCSLVQNAGKESKIYTYRNGYKIVTDEDDEVVEVRTQRNGGKKLRYYNGYENLKYHRKSDGKVHYKYSYYNQCKKVTLRKNKAGITSVTNKSREVDANEIMANLNAAIKKGANTCASSQYSK
jgi:hypothetical protein